MNTGSLTVIDDYLDALIGGAEPGEIPAAGAQRPAAESSAMDALPVEQRPPEQSFMAPTHAAPSATPHAPPPEHADGPALLVEPLTPAAVPRNFAIPADPQNVRSLAASPATQRWLRVTVGHASYAVELLSVQEVVRLAPIVAMRGAQRAVLGVMNLRGRIVPVFDLGLWLGTAGVEAEERSRIVVVERNDELIGVLVTAVDDVVWLGRDRIEPPLAGTQAGPILGIARVGATPTVLLDAGELFG